MNLLWTLYQLGVWGLIIIALQIINLVLGIMLTLTGWFFDWTLKLSTNINAGLDIINIGWETSLQFANMFFIIILLAIAIGTILQVNVINKKLLPTFLLVAILINFSMVIGGTIIDISNVFALSLSDVIKQSGSPSEMLMVAFAVGAVDKFTNDDKEGFLAKVNDISKNFSDLILLSFFQIFSRLIANFIFIAGAVYMIQRAFWLWLLLMIAPLAWIALIIPGQKKHWTAWWDKFIKWCLFAPTFLFFLYLSLIISTKATKLGVTDKILNSFSASTIIQLTIVAFLMFMGIIAGNKLGVAGSNFVMNYANKARGAASKKFSELRSKTPWSAEKLGAKFGGMGAGLLAKTGKFGEKIGYGRETRERLQQERLEEQQRRENIDNARLKLKNFREGQSDTHKNLEKAERAGDQANIKLLTSKLRDEEINLLKEIRKGTAEGKPKYSMDDIEKFIKAQGQEGAPAPATPKP